MVAPVKTAISLISLLLCLSLGLPAQAQADSAPYVVGAILSLSGPDAGFGNSQRDTLLMLQSEINRKGGINGHPLNVIIEDDHSINSQAVKAVKKLIEQDRVHALIGSTGTGPTLSVIPFATTGQTPLVSLASGAAITAGNKWVFRACPTDTMALNRILQQLHFDQSFKIGMLFEANAVGRSARDQLRTLAPRHKISIVTEEPVAEMATDVSDQLERIQRLDAQAIVFWGGATSSALVVKNIRQLNINLPLFLSSETGNDSFLALTGKIADGVKLAASKFLVRNELPLSDPQRTIMASFAGSFRTAFGREPDTSAIYASDALQIIVSAMKKAGGDSVALRNEIEKTIAFRGVTGTYNYTPNNHDGLSNDALVMIRNEKGRWRFHRK